MKMLLTTLLAASLAGLGACASSEERDATPAQGATCLPPNCTYSTARPAGRTATSAKPTVKPRP